MTDEEFTKILDSRLEKTRKVLASKAREYATDQDKLHNFKRSASITGERPSQVCVGFLVKHLVSVLDIVEENAAGHRADANRLDEKIGDAINYLILLEAILLE